MLHPFDPARPTDVVAISSGGGHWEQLTTLADAFEGQNTLYVCAGNLPSPSALQVTDANINTPVLLAKCFWQLLTLIRQHRPRCVVSTGAAPGAIAIVIGRHFGARTLFIDSIANTERPSLSARLVRRFATQTLTQWPEVSRKFGLAHKGAVL